MNHTGGVAERSRRFEQGVEIATWVIIILALIFIRFIPKKLIDTDEVYFLGGGILSFALFYYYVASKFLTKRTRVWVKNISDVVFIGILIHLLKDFQIYFFALYFIPLIAGALMLNLIDALLIATIAALFVGAEIILSGQGLIGESQIFLGTWQIAAIMIITLFTRFLAIQLNEERKAKRIAIRESLHAYETSRIQKEFTAQSAHHLMTPLSIIQGDLSLVLSGDMGKLTPKQKRFLNTVYRHIQRLIHLVQQMLELASSEERKVALNIQKVDLLSLISDVVEEMHERARGKQVAIIFEKPREKIPPMLLDPDKIEEVFINLLDNAIKYTERGHVILTVHSPKEQWIEIDVADTGIGIKKEELPHLFTRFYRAPEAMGVEKEFGTGLGLSITKLLVEKHGGKIWATSTFGKGSTFSVKLPVAVG
jgi:signal transduction histidine kinase